ncbi:hypothetical protein BGZ81_004391 [Podila clonocystis]|nr:hypothetical protein BGZ81_004391 [Podila clonocystis]
MFPNPELITQDPPQAEPVESSDLDTPLQTSDDMTRTRTDPSSPSSTLSSSSPHTSSTSSELPSTSSTPAPTSKAGPSSSPLRGARGPIGPRPGVYRPCARCRVKKTKCDKAKPTCSSCQKGGPGVTCIYDNDEPSDGSPPTTPVPPKVVGKSPATTSKAPSSKPDSNGSRTARSTKGKSSKDTPTTSTGRVKSEPEAPKAPSVTGPPQKKHKSSPGTAGSTMNPSPLRTSITTIKLPTKTSSSSASTTPSSSATATPTTNGQGSKRKASISSTSPTSKPTHTRSNSRSKAELEINEDVDVDEEVAVTDLSIKEKDANEKDDTPPKEEPTASPTDTNLEKTPSSTSTTSAYPSTVPSFRPKKHPTASISVPIGGSAGTYNYGQAKIIGELNASRPTPPFVIDKNQKARKWGRSPAVIQTLGGEVALPLWTSSQEMLLNDPRPAFVQRPVPTSSRPGTNLARLAVLRQMDNNNNSTTPERGNTPESKEGSPAPQSTGIKKKRGPRKHDGVGRSESGTSPIALKKSQKRARTDSGASGTDYLEDALREHSVRSTPTPTPSSRPRTFACSFEGCGKSFMDKFHLDKHENRHVTEEIVCGIDGCTKAYNSISTVRRHQSIMHKDKKLQAEEARAAAAAASGTQVVKKKKSMLSKTQMASPSQSMSASSTRASSPKSLEVRHGHHQHSEAEDETEHLPIMVD